MTKIWLVLAASVLFAGCVSNAPKAAKSSEAMEKDAAQYNLQLGVGYLRKGENQLALEKLTKSLEQNPSLSETHMALAYLYQQTNQPKNAELHLRRAVKLSPNDPEVLNSYAVFLCKQGSTKDALKVFDKAAAVPLYRTPEAAYTNAGVCARGANRLDDAEGYFRKALDKNPGYDEALLQLASLNFERAKYFPARAFLERFLQANPATPEALWLGVQNEAAMANAAGAKEYGIRLLREFPDSGEARRYLEQRRNGN